MEKYFRQIDGKFVNIVKHTIEQLNKYAGLQIYISTDSQSFGCITRYATCIVYRYGKNGAHFITYKQEVPREKVEYMRLYNEGLRTLEVAEILRAELPSINPVLEFDYADVKKTISSNLVSVFKGYQNARFKSSEMLASKAADNQCRSGNNMFDLERALKEVA